MVDLDAVTRGNRLELARLLTEVENQTPAGEQALDRLFARASPVRPGRANHPW